MAQSNGPSSASNNDTAGAIRHLDYLSEDVGSLYLSETLSDVVLIVKEKRFPAHKFILVARSEYFRALLCGDMMESNQREVIIEEKNPVLFETLLRYLYTGRLALATLNEREAAEMICLADKYLIDELASETFDYLKRALRVQTFFEIFGSAFSHSQMKLVECCLEFADRNASEILMAQGFLDLDALAIEELIRRDTFAPPESEIFRAVSIWVLLHGREQANSLLGHVRLWDLPSSILADVVRRSGLFSDTQILDAIVIIEGMEKPSAGVNVQYRASMKHDTNVVAGLLGAQVFKGRSHGFSLCANSSHTYDDVSGFISHPVNDCDGIVVKLGARYMINHIRLLLWDRAAAQILYSYYVEVSATGKSWTRVVDYSSGESSRCGWQDLYFGAEATLFIRVRGKRIMDDAAVFRLVNYLDADFRLVHLEAEYCSGGNRKRQCCAVQKRRDSFERCSYSWRKGDA